MIAGHASAYLISIVLIFQMLFGLGGSTDRKPISGPTGVAVITEDTIRKHVVYLASDELSGRLPGTPGAEKAARYIADNFKQAGLKPSGTKGFFQEFPFVSKLKLGKKNQLAMTLAGTKSAAKLHQDFVPVGFSSPGMVSGEVVFAGFGISAAEDAKYDDYAGLDVKGKLVLVLPYSPTGANPHAKFGAYSTLRYKAATAKSKGATGILIIAEDEDFKSTPSARLVYDESYGDSGIPAVVVSRALGNQFLKAKNQDVAGLEKRLAESLTPEAFALPQTQVVLQTEVIKERQTGQNVVGWLEGSDPQLKNEIVVIGAHYDHLGLGGANSLAPKEGEIHNGADDNASGTSGVIELARAFASAPERPKRSLMFMAFSAEEKGLLGSAYFTENPIKPLSQVVAMINMDMVGRLRDNNLMIQGMGTATEWKGIVEKVNQTASFNLKLQDDGFGPSDHSSFYRKQIPVLFFFTGNHEDYHRPSDDADKINYEGERNILSFVFHTATAISNQPVKPTYQKAKSDDQGRRGGGFRVYVGSIPDYAAEVEGVKLSGVREGSPAEKAGIKAGDVIVKMAGRDVKNVYDYTYVLQELKPDQEVEVVVLRGTERVTLKLTPGKR